MGGGGPQAASAPWFLITAQPAVSLPGAEMPQALSSALWAVGGWGLVAAGWVLGPRAVASRSTDCVFICPTFCTGSCCQRVNQVDEWPDLRRGNQQSRKRPEQWATLLAGDVPGPTACHHPFSGKCFDEILACVRIFLPWVFFLDQVS